MRMRLGWDARIVMRLGWHENEARMRDWDGTRMRLGWYWNEVIVT